MGAYLEQTGLLGDGTESTPVLGRYEIRFAPRPSGIDPASLCGVESDLAPGTTITFPSRWAIHKGSTRDICQRLTRLAQTVITGTEAVTGVYMRMCDMIRQTGITDEDVRKALTPLFSPPRIAELLRVAHAPNDVYERYTGGFFSFKAALHASRLYHITPTDELRRRKLQRAADRLITLMGGEGEIRVKDRLVKVRCMEPNCLGCKECCAKADASTI